MFQAKVVAEAVVIVTRIGRIRITVEEITGPMNTVAVAARNKENMYLEDVLEVVVITMKFGMTGRAVVLVLAVVGMFAVVMAIISKNAEVVLVRVAAAAAVILHLVLKHEEAQIVILLMVVILTAMAVKTEIIIAQAEAVVILFLIGIQTPQILLQTIVLVTQSEDVDYPMIGIVPAQPVQTIPAGRMINW